MNDFIKKIVAISAGVISACFTVLPESFFNYKWLYNNLEHVLRKISSSCPMEEKDVVIIIGRLVFVVIIFLITAAFYYIYKRYIKRWRNIKGQNYSIQVKYGNIFKQKGKKVIAFDECFTTKVGKSVGDIKSSSICGQYLKHNPIEDINPLIEASEVFTEESKSLYLEKTRYKSGTLIPVCDGYLLLAFAKLDEKGRGFFRSREEYLQCLSFLWEELDSKYEEEDVNITVLGSGLTRIGDVTPNMQELVDLIIYSYKLSPYKIKKKLKIICKRDKDFSLDKIGTSV